MTINLNLVHYLIEASWRLSFCFKSFSHEHHLPIHDRCGWMCLESLPAQGHLHRRGGRLSVPMLTRVAREVVPIGCRRVSGQPVFECRFLQKCDRRLLLQVHWRVDGQKLWDELVSVFYCCSWFSGVSMRKVMRISFGAFEQILMIAMVSASMGEHVWWVLF